MKFLLILSFFGPGGQPNQLTAGVMVDHDTCIVAGGGMELVLEAANPGLEVRWTCLPAEQGANT